MYGTSHSLSTMNGMDIIDGSGTIDPANLSNSVSVALPAHSPAIASPRGVKRSRTPDHMGNGHVERDQDDEEQSRRKRGRPPKTPRPSSNEHAIANTPIQTPQMQARPLSQATAGSPSLVSPESKSTPTKALVKALPTVRDHTSDQLNEEGDEYIPKEFDEAGETKADPMGYPQGGREYKCRTFRVPLRGSKLFMLATECARVLNYRDSYLLFNKNRSLHKIIASQIEKDDLIQQDILPYSYRSRQIAIVSARSMFRQFGSRVIVNGRRVRDDYWETKARKQGFTEDDLAGEKRPGAAKARDGSVSEPATNLLPALPHNDVVYSNAIEPLPHGLSLDASESSIPLAPLPMNHMSTTDDPRLRDYTVMSRARQELTGQPYHDRTQTSSAADLINQAQHTSDFNKMLSIQRRFRQKGLDEFYSKPREAPVSETQSNAALESGLSVSQPVQVSQIPSAGIPNPAHTQHMLPQQVPMQPNPMMGGQPGYPQQAHPQSVGQSPMRIPPNMQPAIMQQRPNPSMGGGMGQAPPYGYSPQQQQIWGQPPPQPQPSPLPSSGHQGVGMSQYGQQMPAAPQQSPSPLGHHPQQQQQQQQHHHQSPRNQQRQSIPQMPQQYSQMQHPQAAQAQGMQGMGYPGANPAGYPGMARPMYPPNQAHGGQPFMGGNPQQAGLAMNMAGNGMPGWPTGPGGPMQPGQPQPGQSGSPLGGGWSY